MKPSVPQIPESAGPSARAGVQPEIADSSHENVGRTRGLSRRPSGARPKAAEIDHPDHLKEGDLDPATGYKIGHLIGAYETCIIYLDEAGDLHYWTTQKHEWPDEAAFAAIEVEGFHLRAATGPHVNAHDRYQINCMTAQAIALALESHDFVGARTALARARELLGQSQRIRIVIVTLGLVTFGVIVAIVVYLWRGEIQHGCKPACNIDQVRGVTSVQN